MKVMLCTLVLGLLAPRTSAGFFRGTRSLVHSPADDGRRPSSRHLSTGTGAVELEDCECSICSTDAGNDGNKPNYLKLQYVGVGAGTGYQGTASTCTLDEYPSDSTLQILDNDGYGVSYDPIHVGDNITLTSNGDFNGKTQFDSVMTFQWLGYEVVECVIQTDCYAPLIVGDQIGPFKILAGRGINDYDTGCDIDTCKPKEEIKPVPCDVPACDVCEDYNPETLYLRYMPADSDDSDTQDKDGRNMATCTDKLDYPMVVEELVVSGMKASVMSLFENVIPGAIFEVPTNGGSAVTFLFNSDFECAIHTSCSAPLLTGMQLGPFLIVGSVSEGDGAHCLSSECLPGIEPPTRVPTEPPTPDPTFAATTKPPINPGMQVPPVTPAPTSPSPSSEPSVDPSTAPSSDPSGSPSASPSSDPSSAPSASPSASPSLAPSPLPSESPSNKPSVEHSGVPSPSPSNRPTVVASDSPSSAPTASPSSPPSSSPSAGPTQIPTPAPPPTNLPTMVRSPTAPSMIITGTVFEDLNNDDLGDMSDGKIENVLIALTNVSGVVVATTLTNENGFYRFDVAPSSYVVTQTNLPGFSDVSDLDGGDPNSIFVESMENGMDMGNDFVDERPLDIAGTVLEDENGDMTGDRPIVGVLVTLQAISGNVIIKTLTDSNGSYIFESLPPDSYIVTETNILGFTDVSDSDGGDRNSISVELVRVDSTGNDFVDEQVQQISRPVTIVCPTCDFGETVSNAEFQDFEKTSTGWEGNARINRDNAANFTNFLGPYERGDDYPRRKFVFDKSVTRVVIQFDFYEIDGWDGDHVEHGDDKFQLKIGDCVVDFGHFNNVASDAGEVNEPDGPAIESACGVGWRKRSVQAADFLGFGEDFRDQKHRFVVTIPKTLFSSEDESSASLLVEGAWTLVGTKDERVGIDNFCFIACTGGTPSPTPENIQNAPSAAPVDEPVVATVQVTVLEDLDNDDEGDIPIPGVLITIIVDDEGTERVVATTLTDSNGFYQVDLEPGSYKVTQTNLNSTYTDVKEVNADFFLSNGATEEVQFVDERFGSIAGTVMEDTNDDTTGDVPLEGVLIVLKDESSDTVATTLTNSTGSYLFEDLVRGTYNVDETNLPGFEDVSDIDPDNGDNTILVQIGDGEPLDSIGNDFVDELEELGSISGNVSEDQDDDDTGDVPIPSVTITLVDLSGSDVATTFTDADGNYVFYDLPAGNYTVEETDLIGTTSVSDIDGPANGDNLVAVAIGEAAFNSTGNDFVDETPEVLGSIAGTVTEDIDQDTIGDAPLASVPIALKNAVDDVIATTMTNSTGSYLFVGVAPGIYNVDETNLPGFKDVSDIDPDNGDNTILVQIGDSEPLDSSGNDFVDEVAPVTNAPVTNAPVTNAPVTAAPVTDAPVTDAPVTAAPVTNAPVTNAPAKPPTKPPATIPPLCQEVVIIDFQSVEILDKSGPERRIEIAFFDGNIVTITGTANEANEGEPRERINLYNTLGVGGCDHDLEGLAFAPSTGVTESPNLGNILIIQENGNTCPALYNPGMGGIYQSPNDENGGGKIKFDFRCPVDIKAGARIFIVDQDGSAKANLFINDMFVQGVGGAEDSEVSFFDLTETMGVKTIEIVLDGSGGVGKLEICVPNQLATCP